MAPLPERLEFMPPRRLGHSYSHVTSPSRPPIPTPPPPNPPLLPPAAPPRMPPLVTILRPDYLQALVVVLLLIIIGMLLLCVLPLYCLRDKAFLTRLCSGRTSKLLNAVCCVPVMCYNSATIYAKPCVRSCCAVVIDGLLFAPFRRICCKCCCRFTDRKFPPNPASIGSWQGKSFADEDIAWVRARDLLGEGQVVAADADAKGDATGDAKPGGSRLVALACGPPRTRVKLFEDEIDPRDVSQGAVGDCWLIAAFAAAAEHPGLVKRLFLTNRANPKGRYAVRLFDWQAKRWVVVTVDENLPAGPKSKTQALFAQPRQTEIWVALLEKAFAKFVGSYGALDGGSTAWALNALTGDPVFELRKDKAEDGSGNSWERIDMRAKHDEKNKRAVELVGRAPSERHSSLQTFLLLRRYSRLNALMGASFGSCECFSTGLPRPNFVHLLRRCPFSLSFPPRLPVASTAGTMAASTFSLTRSRSSWWQTAAAEARVSTARTWAHRGSSAATRTPCWTRSASERPRTRLAIR